ncbi:5'-nucleotidase, lipoprotein e(P4) family [Pantoea ananatis]|jgi:5'-nucleotidase (lipoprotein e(P4) family)|uniref:5'-nucleotidase, lipoprotein e(P4) family n=1 Tax=Pantoea ananas TaxID=553 RepID=UPI000CEB5F1E|nr:5'-nucleotidase, lipoprotein e(P4) family [Pantoea ananatis]AVG74542.1 5'-nucleotidase, lipoprotein e(P4) family [Pantoea ananatis]MDN4127175.1 5'-nucleotidase, lipoprotein e(P4) family [Pantoea ananatis]MDN4150842.1 5'-nucleotidase, lipoprotein e(P4) family [Pantoea ananatis]PKC36968.1 membrane protein [Pantoea ananatis 15320]PQK85828.1 5'-nucleotidase, lipoprotein e(P4) family [Pantoea ananatis]
MKNSVNVALSAMVVLALAGCAQPARQQAQQQLGQQSVLALDWFQQSGEYQALSWQAFNSARLAFDQSASLTGKPKAVIVDLDETMLDNSAYSAWQAKNGQPFSDKTWSAWTQARQARAVPGAVEFARYVNSHGGTVFYVSNRDQKDYAATVSNLEQLGFSGVSEKTVSLKTDSSNKQARFDAIKNAGYNVVLYIGDNLNDFGGATWHQGNAQRQAFVERNHAQFGTQFIVLPNPLYGDWESGMAENYNKLTPEQQLSVREARLRAWNGK